MHLMIDLETLSTENIAVITQIGYALFNPDDEGVTVQGCVFPDPREQEEHLCRHISVPTFMWWLNQSDGARDKMTRSTYIPVTDALHQFETAIAGTQIDGVWSHGATFDLVVLGSLYQRLDRKLPWDFRAPRDTRTVYWMAGPDFKVSDNPQKHSAEWDAVTQALDVQRALRLVYNR